MSSLLIVESPAKCSKIQGFLGVGWKVIATMGHIRALEEDLDAIGLDRDFEPRYAFLKEKGKAIQQLCDCAKAADNIYLASDDDREGEAISFSVAALLKLPVATTPRIVFHEITEQAVKAALASPRIIDMNRVNAQQARAVLDMMVGFTISPLLWKFVGAGLSAGRCQTPALRLVADREKEITEFIAETTWSVSGQWQTTVGQTFDAALSDPLEDEESASNYLENIHAETEGTVTSAVTRPTMESPPKPLITSTLQQEASALYGAQPKNTMRIAQRLYEAGHITYMRTDSAVLSEEARKAAEGYVRITYGEAFLGTDPDTLQKSEVKKVPKKAALAKKDKDSKSQDAHEAIRPTHIETVELPADEDWNAVDRKIYRLIWNRTVQSVMAPCRGEERNVTFRANGDPAEFDWLASWKRTTFQGWRRVNQVIADLDSEGETAVVATTAWAVGQSLQMGSTINWQTLAAAPKETKAAPRYTEATLVRELEKRGIGRPSTFASLIGTIIDKAYVEKRDVPAKEIQVKSLRLERPGQWPALVVTAPKKVGAEKQKLAPTALGQSALDFCMREFANLFAYGFTKEMEERLDAIAEGKESWKQLCKDTWGSYEAHYKDLKSKTATQTQSAKSKTFTGGIKAVQSKKGPLLLIEGVNKDDTVFYGWPKGVSFDAITEAVATAHVAAQKKEREGDVIGEYEGAPMTKCRGPYGEYISCGGTSIPWKEGDTAETIRQRLEEKKTAVLHSIGQFEFRRGPFGVYFFKKDVQKKQFVGLPTAVDPKSLTLEAAVQIYQNGLKDKAKKKSFGVANAAAKKKKSDA